MFNPSLWRMKKFADSVPEMMNLQREINRLFSNAGQEHNIGLSGNQCLGKR